MCLSTANQGFLVFIIGGSKGGRQGCAPPRGPNSFIFMQFSAKNWKIIAFLGVGAPLWGKSWIRHCLWLPCGRNTIFCGHDRPLLNLYGWNSKICVTLMDLQMSQMCTESQLFWHWNLRQVGALTSLCNTFPLWCYKVSH